MKLAIVIFLFLFVNIESKRKHHRRRHKLSANSEPTEAVPYNYESYPATSTDFRAPAISVVKAAEVDHSAGQTDQPKVSWKNHTIPFLKDYIDEIDEGKIKHHNYESLTWFMKFYAEEYPEIARMYEIGKMQKFEQSYYFISVALYLNCK